jgi:hypothetical protein
LLSRQQPAAAPPRLPFFLGILLRTTNTKGCLRNIVYKKSCRTRAHSTINQRITQSFVPVEYRPSLCATPKLSNVWRCFETMPTALLTSSGRRGFYPCKPSTVSDHQAHGNMHDHAVESGSQLSIFQTPSGSPSQDTTGTLTPDSDSFQQSLSSSILVTFENLRIEPDPSSRKQFLSNSSLDLPATSDGSGIGYDTAQAPKIWKQIPCVDEQPATQSSQ